MNETKEYNFTGGMPDPDAFPIEGLIEAARRILPRVGGKTLVRYPGDYGDIHLREIAARRFGDREGIEISPSEFAVTNGSMQAIDLILRAHVRPGDTVLVEEVSYMGTLAALRHYRANLVGIPVDGDGMRTDALETELRSMKAQGIRPSLLIAISVNQNPTGANLSLERKCRLVELAEEHDVLVLEDECYADIHFEGQASPAMYGFAPRGRVVSVGTFSKVIAPGMRLGYLMAPPSRMGTILEGRFDGGTSAFASIILAEYLRDHLWEHIKKITEVVRRKRDAVVSALNRHLGGMAVCNPPKGGLFAWVRLPEATDMARLMALCAEQRILCSRGQIFDAKNQDIPYVRFSYGYPTFGEIEEGITLFADCARKAQR